jgi:hypothetical protein
MYIVKLIGRSPAGRRRDKQYHMQSKMAADDLAHRARNNSLKAHVPAKRWMTSSGSYPNQIGRSKRRRSPSFRPLKESACTPRRSEHTASGEMKGDYK